MSRIINHVAAAAIAAGLCSAALTLSPTAAADPATPVNPALPGLNMLQQLASQPGSAITGLLQSAAGVLGAAPPAPTTQPGAVASINLPQLPQPAAPPPAANASITLPQAPAPSATPATAPTAGLPLPAPLSVPADLGALLPSGIQIPGLTKPPAPAPAPVESPLAGLLPAVAPAPLAPAPNPLGSLLPFSALP